MENEDMQFNPFDPEQTHHMFDLMARLRSECPVSRPSPGFVYLARFDENSKVFRDARTFLNAGGFRESDVVLPESEQTLGEMDPPLHPRVRRLMLKAFTPAAAEESRSFAADKATRLLESFAAAGGGDAVANVTLPLPIAVTANLLGMPEQDVEQISEWSFQVFNSTWPARNETERGSGLENCFPEFCSYVDDQIAQRRTAGAMSDDLISRMLLAEEQGERLNDVQVRTLTVNVLLGSLSTTLLMANMLYRFVADPEFEDRLRSEPSLVPSAVEESLRLEPPVILLFRTAATAVELADEHIDEQERIILGIASANRDEAKWDDPESFRLDRPSPDSHLAFGAGPHQCIGKDVARVEAQEMLKAVLEVFGPHELSLAPDFEYEFVPHFLEYGPEHLPLVSGSPRHHGST